MASKSKYKDWWDFDNGGIYPTQERVFIRRHWRRLSANVSKGGERMDQTLVVHPPQIEWIHAMATFDPDAPPNERTDAPRPDSLYKVGRDANGNKARMCIYTEYWRLSPRWYRKKSDMESHLRRKHGIDIVLPRGMRIEEGTLEACFNSYKRQRSLKRFMDPEIKYNRNRQTYIRKLKVRVVLRYNSISVELCLDTEAEFVARFMDNEMAIHDSKKDERLEMLTKKITSGLDSYCKKARISTQSQGVSMDVSEALNPSEGGVSTPSRWRRQKMPVRWKEVESNIDVVHQIQMMLHRTWPQFKFSTTRA